jgi:hypothetical protein
MFRSQRNFTGWIRECVFLKGLSKKKGKAAPVAQASPNVT